jgi:hypothetical protein
LPELIAKYGGNGENSGVNGTFYSDTFTIGGTTLQSVDVAVVYESDGGPIGGGILGLSFDTTENTNVDFGIVYPDVLDDLYNAGIIGSHSFSLYLDDLGKSTSKNVFNSCLTLMKLLHPVLCYLAATTQRSIQGHLYRFLCFLPPSPTVSRSRSSECHGRRFRSRTRPATQRTPW